MLKKCALRSLLGSLDPKRVEDAGAKCTHPDSLRENFSKKVPVYFLGARGSGKRTLLNGLMGESQFPQGGIGSLSDMSRAQQGGTAEGMS